MACRPVRRPLRLAALVLTILLPSSAVAAAQDVERVRSARITGVVVADDTGLPLDASVRLLGGPQGTTVSTDEHGAFDIVAPPGSYLITAVTAGYVAGTAGQRTPADPPALFDLAPGDSRYVEIRLLPLGRVAGTILDEDGRPAAGVDVHALRAPTWGCATAEGVALSPAQCGVVARATTDAAGRFRIDNLRSGMYHVIAVRPATMRAPASAATVLPQAGPPGGALTYFPGTPFPDAATPLEVMAGVQAEASFALLDSPLTRIAGRVVDSSRDTARNAVVMLLAKGPQPFSLLPRTVELAAGGRFEFTDVPAGEYVIAVRDMTKFVALAQPGGRTGDPFTGELADVPVRVPSSDLEDLQIVTAPGFDLSGTLVLDGRPARDLDRARVSVVPGGDALTHPLAGGAVSVAPDGTFRLPNLVGPQRVLVSLPPGLTVQRIVAGGADITDEGIDISAGHVTIEVVIGPLTWLSGRVTTSRGESVPGMSVVAFADDPRLWTAGGTRHVRVSPAALDGSFRIEGLPAGRYYVAAVPAAAEGHPTEVDSLEPLIPRAARVEIEPGARISAIVRID